MFFFMVSTEQYDKPRKGNQRKILQCNVLRGFSFPPPPPPFFKSEQSCAKTCWLKHVLYPLFLGGVLPQFSTTQKIIHPCQQGHRSFVHRFASSFSLHKFSVILFYFIFSNRLLFSLIPPPLLVRNPYKKQSFLSTQNTHHTGTTLSSWAS